MTESIDIFPWNENFCTGLAKIDEQHKKLVIILNRLANQAVFSTSVIDMNAIFQELINYTVYHFKTEEDIWHQYLPNHQLSTNHKLGHDDFVQQVITLQTQLTTTPSDALLEQMISFLTQWLASHILESDRYMAILVMMLQQGVPLKEAKAHSQQQMQGSTRRLINVILSSYANLSTNTLHLMRKTRLNYDIQQQLVNSEKRFEEAMYYAQVGYWDLVDLHAPLHWSDQMYSLFGLSKDQQPCLEMLCQLIPVEYQHTLIESITSCYNNGIEHNIQYPITRPSDGTTRWIECRGKRIASPDGKSHTISGFSQDITAFKNAETKLIEQQQRLQFINDNSPFYIARCNKQQEFIYATQSYAALFGLKPDDIVGQPVKSIFGEIIYQEISQHIDKVLSGVSVTYDLCLFTQELLVQYVPEFDEQQQVVGYITGISDITERKQLEQKLRLAAKVFESNEGIFITDTNRAILQVNKAFSTITGYPEEELIGKQPNLFNTALYDDNFHNEIWNKVVETDNWEGEIWHNHKNGSTFPAYLFIDAVRNENQCITNYVITINDMTIRKNNEQKIQQLAFYDPLTELPNRRLLLDRLNRVIISNKRLHKNNAVLFLDIDHFKMLNDTHGHDVGDLLLTLIATRLSDCIRKEDTLARIGGDEFVIILEGLDEEDIIAASKKTTICTTILTRMNDVFQLNDIHYNCTTSIGVVLFKDHLTTTSEVMKQADIAMYQAKLAGRNTVRFFDPKMQEAISKRAALEAELHQAVTQHQFKLFYQLQVDQNQQPVGVEALIRWQHPTKGIVGPVEFIPYAEESGLILPIGQWVLETACAQLKQWQQQCDTKHLTIAVNVSSKQFRQKNFVDTVIKMINHYYIDVTKLKMELTESLLLDDIDNTIIQMNALGRLGILFSLDDFGTGYSSLQYLKKLPLSQLKIDRSFVDDLLTDPSDQSIVKTIISMADSLGFSVIAEGVETIEQKRYLLDIGCSHFQGYLFSKPMPISEIEQLISNIQECDLVLS
ncbi:bacteriohemerythrin [Shewanella glacialimarina]|uniref:bacteriohemerythrin n=1 Tax=Shewanella glacialimarina TaxID=2590884 RepID=UPI001CF887FD|nr:bacteriohemerythrin [Shewanella glacialimarina]UCX03228.1 bacteriohemerythrin [Shewanella glacialimarina]